MPIYIIEREVPYREVYRVSAPSQEAAVAMTEWAKPINIEAIDAGEVTSIREDES